MSQLEDLFRSLAQQLVEVSKVEAQPDAEELVPFFAKCLMQFLPLGRALTREQRQTYMDNAYVLRQFAELLPLLTLACTEDDEALMRRRIDLPIIELLERVLDIIEPGPQSETRALKQELKDE
jgi:hypothetical protein